MAAPGLQTLRSSQRKKVEQAALPFGGVFGGLNFALKSGVEFFDENIPVL